MQSDSSFARESGASSVFLHQFVPERAFAHGESRTPSFPTTTTLYLFLLQYTRLPISVDPIFPARFWVSLLLSLLFSFILSFSLPFFRLRYVLSGLASPLHLSRFPDAPFASSCHRFLLPPASYKDVGNLFILASRDRMPRSVEKAAGARLPTRRLCAGGPCSPKYRTRRHSVLGIFHGLFLACRLFSCSLLLSPPLSLSRFLSFSPLPTVSYRLLYPPAQPSHSSAP